MQELLESGIEEEHLLLDQSVEHLKTKEDFFLYFINKMWRHVEDGSYDVVTRETFSLEVFNMTPIVSGYTLIF